MSDVNAIINIDVNSTSALTNLKRLENQIDQFNRSVVTSNATAAASQQSLNRALLDGINNTGLFTSKITPVESSMTRFSKSLDEGKLSLGEYTRYASSQLPGLSRVFKREFDTIEQVATSRVKTIQTQYLALGKTVDGVTKAIASTPTGLGKGLGTDLAMVQQRQQVFNKLLDDGSTKLLNWGKNTQWAGRQLMVGFTLPLAAFGAAASKTFMEIDKATVSLKRVYGDLSTTKAELDSNVEAVKGLGKEYTKYGITLAETISLSARAAATGATNEQLMAATEQTLRFATLGQMDYNQALDTTISLQTAFAISNEDLGKTVDYLNAVENQTILTMEDMSLAIPRVATVVKGLGGSVEDLAIMMTAMREGGVSAENAANGLKSGLASLINPTDRASEGLAKMGVNLNSIISQNKGDLMGIITEFGTAINKLDEFSRQQVLEQVFGKYQYARMSALFTNITKDAGQAARAMDIAGMSAADLAKISEKELGQISESTSVKFQAAMEQLKISIAPIGEAFLKGITPIVNMVSKIADAFNNLPDGVKNTIAVVTGLVAGLGPVFLMTIGLLGNGLANLTKGFQFFRKMIAGIKGDASAFTWLAQGELEAVTASKALENSSTILTDKLLLQRGAVSALTAEYERFAVVAGIAGARMGGMGGGAATRGAGGRPSLPAPRGFATGGIVPGTGNGDTIPALLTPGESVITKEATQKYAPILQQMNDGTLPGFAVGGINIGNLFRSRSLLIGGSRLQYPEGSGVSASVRQLVARGAQSYADLTKRSGKGWKLLPESVTDSARKSGNMVGHIHTRGFQETTGQTRRLVKSQIDELVPDNKLRPLRTPKYGRTPAEYEILPNQYMMFPQTVNDSLRSGTLTAANWVPAKKEDMISIYDFLQSRGVKQGVIDKVAERAAQTINERMSRIGIDGRRPIGELDFGGLVTGSTVKALKEFETQIISPSSLKLASGGVSIGQAIKSWQTSSRSVRENPEMLGALMSGMRPSGSKRTLTRGTTLGLSRGSEFAAADERMIMEALRSGNSRSLIGREFDMRGPISYTAGNTQSAVNAMAMNTDVNRIRELKRQHSEAKQTNIARLKRIENLKKKIESGRGPISTYQRQLEELEGFTSMYAASQKTKGREIKSLTSRGYEDLLIEQRFNPQDSLLDVNAMNPSGTFMGKDVSRESEFISSGSKVRVSGITTDPNTGLTKLVLENIVDNVQRRALGGPIVPGTGSSDTVPAMLTPGEFVINKKATQSNLPLLHAINNGQTVNKNKGGMIDGVQYLAEGDEVQSARRTGYKAPPQIARQTSNMPEWSTQQAEIDAATRAAQALGATTEQINNNLNRVAAHLVEGQGEIKDWVANNLMADLQAVNQYMNRVPAVAKTILKDTQMIDEVARQTGLSSTRVAKELDLLVKKVHPSTVEAASVLRRLSELDAQASIAVQNAREQARLSGTRLPSSRTSLGTESETGYLAAMTAATLGERERGNFYGTLGERAYVTPEGGYQTRSAGGNQQIPDVSPTLNANQQEQDVYKELRQKNPTMKAQEAFDVARKKVLYSEAKQLREKYGMSLAASFAAAKASRAATQEEARNSQSQQEVQVEDISVPTLEQEEESRRQERRQGRKGKIGKGLRAGGGAMMMASMAPMMMANPETGKFMGVDAGLATGGLMATGMLAEFAPMLMKLPPQVAIAGAAIAAIGVGFVIWRKSVDDAAKKTAELGANMGGTSNALNTMAQILGQQTPSQKSAQMQLGFTAEQQQQAASQFQPMLESETGQKFIKDLESATSADRFKKLSDYLKTAIASGMMDTKSANVFAKTIASTLSDPILGQSIIKSISGQKSGATAMLGLAQNRETGVIAGNQLQTLQSNQTVEETTASSVIGSSIQLIQDFSNAAALAKEEFTSGRISYSKYKDIIDQSTIAQEKYTQSITDSLIKTEDLGATMQAWGDQLTLAGISPEQQKIIQQSATKTVLPERSTLEGILIGNTGQTIRQLFGGQADLSTVAQAQASGQVTKLQPEVLAAATKAVLSGMSIGQVAAISAEITKGGAVADVFKRTKDLGMAGLQYNLQNSAVAGLAFTPEMTDRQKATVARGQQQYMGAAEKFKGAGFDANVFQGTVELASDQNIAQMAAQLNEMDNQKIAATIRNIDELKSVIGPEGMSNIINVTLAENPPDLDKKLPTLSRNLMNIVDNIPDDVQKALGINITSNVDINEWGPLAVDIANLIPILDELPSGVRQFAMNIMVNKNGEVLKPKEFLDESLKINEAFEKLSSKNLKVKKNAIIDLMTIAKGPGGETLDNPSKAYQDMVKNIEDEFGKGAAMKLQPDTYVKVITLQLQIQGVEKMVEEYKLLAIIGKSVNPDTVERALARLALLKGQQSGAAGGDVAAAEINKPSSGGGGGGGGTNPLLDFKKSLLEQIKLYTDLSMTMGKLFSSKKSILNLLNKNNGVDDALRSAGLGETMVQGIMGMGADVAKKWIGKNISGGKLNVAGQKQQTIARTNILGAAGSQAEGAIITATAQQQASRYLLTGKYGKGEKQTLGKASGQVLSMIAGSPELADAYVAAVNEVIAADKKYRSSTGEAKKKAKNEWDEKRESLEKYLERLNESAKQQTVAGKLTEARTTIIEDAAKTFAKNRLAKDSSISKELKDAILSDGASSLTYIELGNAVTKSQAALAKAKKGSKGYAGKKQKAEFDQTQLNDFMRAQEIGLGDLELKKLEGTLNTLNQAKAESDRLYKAQTDPLIEQIDLINRQIEGIQKLNDADQNRIRTLNREKEMLERQVEAINRKNEKDQVSIDKLQREDELRSRVADALNHELSMMSDQETKIKDAYDKRIDALDKVAKINDYIINQQKSQLGLAQALSTGDVYAAAAAQQDMQAGSAQFAQEQVRSGLQTGMENQIEGLTTAGGLTRVQAEDQIRSIGEQTYQTNLLIRDLQDVIYGRNLEIAAIKLQERDIDDTILGIQDDIYKRETEIIGIQAGKLTDLNNQLTTIQDQKDAVDKVADANIQAAEVAIENYNLGIDQVDIVHALALQWREVVKQIDKANLAMKDKLKGLGDPPTDPGTEASKAAKEEYAKKYKEWKTKYDDVIANNKKAKEEALASGKAPNTAVAKAAGGVIGDGGRDSIAAMLTPGEFVMRKASVQKYGAPMLERMNIGAFEMPRYNTQEVGTTTVKPTSNTANINAPVYNTYSINVPVTQPNASANDIANIVMTKIKNVDNSSIRRINGY